MLDDKIPTVRAAETAHSFLLADHLLFECQHWLEAVLFEDLHVVTEVLLNYSTHWLSQCSVIWSFLCKLCFMPPLQAVVQHKCSGLPRSIIVDCYIENMKAYLENMSRQSISGVDGSTGVQIEEEGTQACGDEDGHTVRGRGEFWVASRCWLHSLEG